MNKKKLISGIIVIITIIAVVIIQQQSEQIVDEPIPYDDDLILIRIEVPVDKNALYPIRQAIESFYIPENKNTKFNDIADDKKQDEEFVREILNKNKATLEYFEKATQLSAFQYPLPKKRELAETVITLRMQSLLDVVKLASIKANYLFKQNEEEEAFNIAMNIVRLGYIIENSQGLFIIHNIGSVVKEEGLTKLRSFIPKTTLSPVLLEGYIKELEQYRKPKQGMANVLKLEYELMRQSIKMMSTGEIDPDLGLKDMSKYPLYYFKPNQTKRLFAETYRFFIEKVLASAPYNEVEDFIHPELKGIDWDTPETFKGIENAMGKKIYQTMFSFFMSRYYERIFSVTATQILLAKKSYQIKNGELPEFLTDFVPQYFTETPIDPFNGKYIRYCKEKRIIYSVGRNFIDEDGQGDDIQFDINF